MSISYQQEILSLPIGGLQVKIARVANFDELLDELIAKGSEHPDYSDERIPYWADLWHSALALGHYLTEHPVVGPGTTVTEIGCGLGLPGLVAGLLGGRVTFTDYLPEAVDMARYNWALNSDQAADFLTMDWREPLPAARAQLLLASDVAYEQRAFEPLLHTFEQLTLPGARIIITEPSRQLTSPWLLELARKYPKHSRHLVTQEYRGVSVKVNVMDIDVSTD